MDRVTIDPSTGLKLAGLDHSVELCDEAGRKIGWFQPAVSAEAYDGLEPPFSADDLRSAERSPAGGLSRTFLPTWGSDSEVHRRVGRHGGEGAAQHLAGRPGSGFRHGSS